MIAHTRMTDGEDSPNRGSDHLYEILTDAGVEAMIGLPRTQTLPLDRTVAKRDDTAYIMVRHETAIPILRGDITSLDEASRQR